MLERSFVNINSELVQWDDETMTFLDIEEGLQGDIVTFEHEGNTYTSHLVNKF